MVKIAKSTREITPGYHPQKECPVIGYGRGECNKCVVVEAPPQKAQRTVKDGDGETTS